MKGQEMLHLCRLRVPILPFFCWANSNKAMNLQTLDLGYASHALIASLPKACGIKVFSYEEKSGFMEFLAYSQICLESFSMSKHSLGDLLEIQSTALPSLLRKGQKVTFRLQACPTIRQKCLENRNKHRERDAFLVAVERYKKLGLPEAQVPSREEVYKEWLINKLSAMKDLYLSRVTIQQFHLPKLQRRDRSAQTKNHYGRSFLKGIRYPIVTFEGELLIENEESFEILLRNGIGRHKAFGLGMLKILSSRIC